MILPVWSLLGAQRNGAVQCASIKERIFVLHSAESYLTAELCQKYRLQIADFMNLFPSVESVAQVGRFWIKGFLP